MRRTLLLLLMLPATVLAADVEFRLITLKNVSDAREVAILRNELILGSEAIDRILITDVLSDGFDENDMVQLYPSGRVLRLAPISPRLDSLLRSYRLPPNVEIHETRYFYTRYDSLSRARRSGQALGYGLMGGIAERIMRGYRGESVEGYFRFGPSGNVVQAWNFDSTKVLFPPPDAPRVDTVTIYLRDTVRVPEVITVTPEPVVIRDTVYLPSELLKKPRGFYYRYALGMFGGGYSAAHRETSRGRLLLGAGNEWDFGVWDPWISGRQDIHARAGLRFMAEMAPWKSDSLSPRFLATSFEGMYIPEWDRSFFAFGGIRAYYQDDLFWDRARAAWDENLYEEGAGQDLAQYEITVKLGLDKFAAFGSGKRFGAWLKLSGWVPGGQKSGYTLTVDSKVTDPLNLPESPDGVLWHWEHDGGTEVEAAFTARLGESAQMMLSAGQITIANLHYDWNGLQDGGTPPSGKGLLRASQFYQTAAVRFAPYNRESTRVMLEGWFRNNTLSRTFKQGDDEEVLDELFAPYFETPELGASVQLDVSIVRFNAGARYFLPPEGNDAQIRPEATLALMFR